MGSMYQGRQMKGQSSQSAFSFMESSSLKRKANRPERILHVRGTRGAPSNKPHWLDAMLGSGSSRALNQSTRGMLERNKKLTRPPQSRVNVEIPKAKNASKGAGKGWIRIGVLAGAALWSLSVIRPIDRMQDAMERWKATQGGSHAEKAVASRAAKGSGEAQASIPNKELRANLTPVIPGLSSSAVALWKSAEGNWYQVDVEGNLNKSVSPQSKENLGLPVVLGAKARKMAEEDRIVLRLDNNRDIFGKIFPLNKDLAPEIESVQVEDPMNPVLVTVDGIHAPLGEGDYQTKQARLALVLRDLAAKNRQVDKVDMRFSNSAVVKLKGR